MNERGAVPWIKDDKTPLKRFARRLADKHPMKDEIVSFRLDPVAISIIGLPMDAPPVVERVGDDLLIAVPGLGSTGTGETIPLDKDHNAERFQLVRRALEDYTGLQIVDADELAAVGTSSTTAAMRLHDRELAKIFGADAWEAWKHPKQGARKKPEHVAARVNHSDASPDHATASSQTNVQNASASHAAELSADERARVAAWFATNGAQPPTVVTRGVYTQVAEIERDPALASAVRANLKRGAGHDRPLDELSLRTAIERARVDVERARRGLGALQRDVVLDAFLGPVKETDPFDSATIPARLVQHDLIIAGRSAHFELALDWGAYRGSTDAAFANRDWHAIVEWVFERVDVQGPASANGQPIAAPERHQTEHMGNANRARSHVPARSSRVERNVDGPCVPAHESLRAAACQYDDRGEDRGRADDRSPA